MKKLLILFILLSFHLISFCNVFNSLFLKISETTIDSIKARLFYEIGTEYIKSKPDSALDYFKKSIMISNKKIEQENLIFLKANSLKSIAFIYCNYFGKYDTSLVISKEAIVLFSKLSTNSSKNINRKSHIGISECYSNNGNVNFLQGNYTEALENFKKALSIAEELSDKKTISSCYNYIGNVYKCQGKYSQSIDCYLKAVKIFEEINDKRGIANCYGNIGNIHYYQSNFNLALNYYIKSLSIFNDIADKKGKGNILICIGNSYWALKNYNSAINYFQKALDIFEQLESKSGMSFCYNNIGLISKSLKDFNQALFYYDKAQAICTEIGDKSSSALIYNNKAEINIVLKEYKDAIENSLKSVAISKKIGLLLEEYKSYSELSKCYDSINDIKNSLKYLKFTFLLKDSLFSLEKNKQLTEMETKYQTEKKQQEIEKQNLELGKQNAEIQKQTILRNSFIASFVLILIIAIVIYRNFRNKKKANIILSQQKVEIQQQKEEIESQRDELQTSNLKLETLNSELEKLSIVASETDNSVVIADKSGEIEWVNEGFTRLFGYTKDEFISINSSNLKKASNNKDIENAIKECINEQKTVTYTTKNKTKSGKSIWTQTTLTPIIKDNTLIKLVAIDSDISKLKQAEEEIKQQKEELQSQSELLIQTNCQLELKNTQITDSIRYAKQIQDAMLPDLSPKPQNSNLKSQDFEFGTWNLEFETFILFNPKDIVSGDFYWFTKTEDYTYIAVADCTGHGVPGAFMSMIGNTLLNEIVAQKKIHNLTQILIKLDEGVNFAINKQQNLETSQEDGMEISICRIDFDKNELQIASTNQSVYIVNKNEFTEIEGGIYSIGGGSFSNKTFETHKIKYFENTIIYLLSDGYQDQFGGENRKKFGSTNLKEFLKSISEKPLAGQKTELENTFISWKGNNKQIDDITVIGFKI